MKDEELDTFIQGELKKDITQEGSVDESVAQHLGEMGFLWDKVQQKMKEDAICFDCKAELVFEDKKPVHIVEASKVEKGVVAFVSICQECFDKNEAKFKEDQKGEK